MNLDTQGYSIPHASAGRLGSTAQRHASADGPIKLMREIMGKYPTFSDHDLGLEFLEKVREKKYEAVLISCVLHCARNTITSIRKADAIEAMDRDKEAGIELVGLRRRQVAQVVSKAVALVKKRTLATAKAIAMDLILINGKKIGDMTGKELRKLGANFARLAQKVPPAKRVRDVMSNEEFLRLWKM